MTLWWLTACVVSGGEQAWLIEDAVSEVEIEAHNGNVSVVARQREGTAIEWSGGGFGMEVTPEVAVDDGVLSVDTRCEGLCGGDLTLSIPDFVAVGLSLDTGDAEVTLPAGADVCVDIGAGSAALSLPGGAYAMDLEIGAGHLSLQGIWDDPSAERTITGSIGAGSLTIEAIDE